MRKLREVLRLRYELKLGYQQIGRSCAIGVSTVHKYLKSRGGGRHLAAARGLG
jgi:DNA-directed RNA polymerase specialized sigma24 family protein